LAESSIEVSDTEIPTHEWLFRPDMGVDEFKTMVREMFDKADENNDGELVLHEFKQFALYALQACQGLPLVDSDAEIKLLFSRFDKNKDKALTWDEIWYSVEPIQAQLAAKHFKWVLTPDMTVEAFEEVIHEMFKSADENSDGVLELHEFKHFSLFVLEAMEGLKLARNETAVEELFKKFDQNKDGKLDWEEVRNNFEPVKAQMASKAFYWHVTPSLTCDEYQMMVRQMFDVADENKDEVLQPEEFKQFVLFVLSGFNGLKLQDSEEEIDALF
jgi:Ca2+-binding EF-hand superfamily protein